MDKRKSRFHKHHTIEAKISIIKCSDSSKSFASIGCSYDLSQLAICSILKNKNRIKEYVKNCGNISTKTVSKRHSIFVERMENILLYGLKIKIKKVSS